MYSGVRNNGLTVCIVIALHMGVSGALHAQISASPGSTTLEQATKSSSENGELGEIIVTANKREQSLNTVGATINAFSGDQLTELHINNVADLADVVPGLSVANSGRDAPVYTLRGVGFYDDSVAAKPDVSIYIDQIPLSLSVMSKLTAFDLERVEVLKGPQGTLFGNNSTGGAINFVAAKPTAQFSAGASVSYSSFDTKEIGAFLSGSVVEDGSVRARLSFKTTQGDGWQRSYTRGEGFKSSAPIGTIDNSNDDLNGSKNQDAARLLVDWDASDKLKFEFLLTGWTDKSQPLANQYIAYVPDVPVVGQPLASYPLAPLNPVSADWVPGIPRSDDRFWQVAARADWQFAGDLTLTDLTSLSAMHYDVGLSPAGVNLDIEDLPANNGPVRSFTQELRVANASTNAFRWVVGGNYGRTSVSETDPVYYQDESTGLLDGFTGGSSGSIQESKTYAAFGNLEFDLIKQVTLRGGLRYSNEKTTGLFFDRATPGYLDPGTFGGPFVDTPAYISVNGAPGYPGEGITNFINYLGHILYPSTWTSVCATCNIIFDNGHSDPDGYEASEHESNVSFSSGVDYKPDENLLLYVTISKGYKAGGFPTLSAATTAALVPAKQESVLDYEIGFKSTLLEHKLVFTGAAFYYDYTDKQEVEIIVDPLFNQLSALVNIPKSRIHGAETELTASPVEGLVLNLNATYLNGKVTSYDGVVGSTAGSGNLGFVPIKTSEAGSDLAFTPTWNIIGRADYSRRLSDRLNGFIGADVSYRTQMVSQIIPNHLPAGIDVAQSPSTALYYINSRALLGAELGVTSADGRWRAALWGKNLTDRYYWNNVVRELDTVVRIPGGEPRQVGFEVGYKFK